MRDSILTRAVLLLFSGSIVLSGHTSLFAGQRNSLNAIIPDFQVNENEGQGGARQESPSICPCGNSHFIVTWADMRNGKWDIFAQRYSNSGDAVGSSFKVNEDIGTGSHVNPSIDSDSSGNFVITWSYYFENDKDIYVQRYSSDGSMLGTNVKVNDEQGEHWQERPSISVDNSGSFVITWHDRRSGDRDVYAQRYSAGGGSAVGANFKVNDDTGDANNQNPTVVSNGDGNFMITWYDERNGNWDVYGQYYTNEGNVSGTNFKINDDTGSEWQISPAVCTDSNDNFIIAWLDQRDGDWNIYAQRYGNDGAAQGTNFKIAREAGSEIQMSKPSITRDSSDNFLIAWIDGRNGDWDIYTQRFSGDGSIMGESVKVNDDQGSADQEDPSLLLTNSGDFTIVWTDERNGDLDIYMQQFSSDITAAGTNLKVNDDVGSADQRSSSICTDMTGNFIITWSDMRNGDWDIYAQRFSSDGSTIDDNFIVNDILGSAMQYSRPRISINSDGDFVIIWNDERNDAWDIYAQRYSVDGTAMEGNFRVNDSTGSVMRYNIASIYTGNNGNFIITWSDIRNGQYNQDIYAQRYSGDGSKIGTNFKASDEPESVEQSYPYVAIDHNGNFIIAWKDNRNGLSNPDIYAQMFSADGVAIGTNFKVNDDFDNEDQTYPCIVIDDNGNFVIVWMDYRNRHWDVYARRYSSDGNPLDPSFKVNDNIGSTYEGDQSADIDSSGNIIIVWRDERNGNKDIYAQRYSADGTAIETNFRICNTSEHDQSEPDVSFRNGRIYTTWTDNRAGFSGFDVWANVLDWTGPMAVNDNQRHKIAVDFHLQQNYPNPFNARTVISYRLPVDSDVELSIFNTAGQKVTTLVSEKQPAGTHRAIWDASDIASGVYVCRFVSGNGQVQSRKLVYMK